LFGSLAAGVKSHFECFGRDARERAAAICFESVLISLLAGIFGAVLAWQLVPVVPRLAANFPSD